MTDQDCTLIEDFVRQCRQPALMEPGEEIIELSGHNFALELRGSRLAVQAWDRTRNLTRRVTAIKPPQPGRLELTVERFARREGQMYLLDLSRKAGADLGSRSGRLVFRERFRLMLRRQLPNWTLAELSAEANLEASLSPAFPRAFLRFGQRGWAAIACPPGGDPAAALTFGLIWLSHLRQHKKRIVVDGLALYAPAGTEHAAALRLRWLNDTAAEYALFAYNDRDDLTTVDPADCGNVDTLLHPCRESANESDDWHGLTVLPGVERIEKPGGNVSLRVRGIEFAGLTRGEAHFGIGEKRPAQPHHRQEIERLARTLDHVRSPGNPDHASPLYRAFPEAWLESQARAQIDVLDASLRKQPLYGQAPTFAGGERGVMDLLAVDHSGRLAVVELKATADLHLPLQALDYWLRVKWHLDRGQFTAAGYFPGIELRPEPPRLLLASPSLEFHPTTEMVLGYFAPAIEVERIGLAVEWRKGLEVMFRLRGALRPR